jgi:general secretion pathway protein M
MNRLMTQIAPLQAAFARLAPRERRLVVAGALALLLTLLFVLVWEPLVQHHRRQTLALEESRALAHRLELIGAEVAALRGGQPKVDRSASLLATVDRAARSGTLGVSPSRLQPEGQREVRVWLDEVVFENLLQWIDELANRHGVVVQTLDVERSDSPGRVNARLTLTRP